MPYVGERKKYVSVAQLDRAQASDAWCRWFESNRVHQKFDKFRLVEFFIHCESNGISSRVSVHFITEGVYHQPQVVLLSQWWYTRLRLDDMQCFAMMIYTPSAWFDSNPSVKRVKYLFYRLFTKRPPLRGWSFWCIFCNLKNFQVDYLFKSGAIFKILW